MDEKFNRIPVSVIHLDKDGTVEKVPIFEPGNSGFKNGNFSFILGSRKELRFVLNRSFHVQLSMRSVTVVKFDILF